MLVLRRHPTFLRLWCAALSSSLASWSFGLALSAHAFLVTGSVAVSAGLVVAATIPAVVAGPLGGVIADRVDRVRVLRVVGWMRPAVVAVLLLPPADRPVAWFAIVLLQATAQQVFVPAEQALVADLVDPDDLTAALGANSVAVNATRLAAPALGGALLGLVGFVATVGVVTALLGVAAVLLSTIRPSVPRPSPTLVEPGSEPERDEPDPADLGARVPNRPLRPHADVRAVAVLQVLDGLKEGAFSTLLPILVLGVIGASPAFMGTASSAFALTALAAGPVVATVVRRAGYRRPIAVGATVSGLLLLLLALAPTRASAVITFAVSGFPFTVSWVAAGTLLLLRTPATHRGRVVGVVGGVYAATTMISATLAGALVTVVDPLLVLGAAAGFQIAAGPVFGWMTRSSR